MTPAPFVVNMALTTQNGWILSSAVSGHPDGPGDPRTVVRQGANRKENGITQTRPLQDLASGQSQFADSFAAVRAPSFGLFPAMHGRILTPETVGDSGKGPVTTR